MFKTGVASISFRKHSAAEIIAEASRSGLDGIEWGSDVHAQPDNPSALKEIVKMSEAYNIAVSSYGTYYRIGKDSADDIKQYIEAAEILGTKTIRIWCGEKGSAETQKSELSAMIEQGKEISELARKNDIKLCLECHQWTLTDDFRSAASYINAVGYSNFLMYWQPNQFKSFDYNIESARALCNITQNIHIFNWDSENRYPLCDAQKEWQEYLEIFKGDNRYALLEFMHDDRLESLKDTALTLKELCYK